tara:strand:+ start:2703 stop:3107 length:405 start_codon:yes stop_codon:yes gene_type:complete
MASNFTNEPINMNVLATETFSMGMLCRIGAGNTMSATAAATVAFFVTVDESSRDAAGVLEVTGATVSVVPMSGVVFVQAADAAYTVGQLVYAGALGRATTTAGSNKLIGVSMGLHTGLTAGDLIAVNVSQAVVA